MWMRDQELVDITAKWIKQDVSLIATAELTTPAVLA